MSGPAAALNRHLIDVDDLATEQITSLFEQAQSFREVLQRPIKKVPALRGKSLLLLFLEPSTRTRTSFETAGKVLSMDVTTVQGASSSIQKGESFLDTLLTLRRFQFDLVVIRHRFEGSARYAARFLEAPVVNAGDGCHAHPTQALVDAFTLWETFGRLKNLNVLIVGDVLHSRVARSNMRLLPRLGANVTACGPAQLVPPWLAEAFPQVTFTTDLDQALPGSDAVMSLRVQMERHGREVIPSVREYAATCGLSWERFRRLHPEAVVMHPGPINRGVEMESAVADHPRSLIGAQVENGLLVRMALLFHLLVGPQGGSGAGSVPSARSERGEFAA